jgi:hypothetical protein
LKFFQFSKKQIRIIAIIIAAVMIIGTVIGVTVGMGSFVTRDSAPSQSSTAGADAIIKLAAEDSAEAASKAEDYAVSRFAAETASEDAGDADDSKQGAETGSSGGSGSGAPAASNTISCTVFVSCSNISNNIDKIDSSKRGLVPGDGVLLPKTTVQLAPGSTAFDALLAATRQRGVHMEYTGSAAAKTVYVEGIGNIYQFDCGSLSGWLYSVNGSYQGVGMSTNSLSNGDAVEVRYTLDLGADLGAAGVRQ